MNIKTYLIIFTFLLHGCASIQHQQRPDSSLCNEQDVTASTCGSSSYISLDLQEHSENPTISFIEFNIDGEPFDQTNIDKVLSRIDRRSTERDKGLLIVVFIHGWHHNAAQTDKNVIEFKNFLLSLQKEEESLDVGTPRSVIGVYMGWQGKASENELINLLSYREKKELGLSTGEKSVTDVLERISKIRVSDRKNRLILVGHSFGGGVLYSAVRKELLNKLRDPNPNNSKLYSDLVVLMNPAVEADRFVDVHNDLRNQFQECTPLSMVSFTSEADTALSNKFPKGMSLFYSELKGSANNVLLTTAYGRYSEFSKYELKLGLRTTVPSSLTKEVFNRAVPSWESFRGGKSPFMLGGITLKQKEGGASKEAWKPVINVLVDQTLIAEHNEIWDPKFTYFLRGLVGMEFAKARNCR